MKDKRNFPIELKSPITSSISCSIFLSQSIHGYLICYIKPHLEAQLFKRKRHFLGMEKVRYSMSDRGWVNRERISLWSRPRSFSEVRLFTTEVHRQLYHPASVTPAITMVSSHQNAPTVVSPYVSSISPAHLL